uniref:UPF0183 protein CG7083 n=1 Tax=Syphacia muris TaxID=451379 RepID=A0A0N5ARP2_9BILA
MLDFEVIPEYGLRSDQLELVLGTPVNQVIAALRDCYQLVDKVEVAYSTMEPMNKDIIIRLPSDGIRLYFEPNTQLLHLIEVYDLSNITLRSCNGIFSQPRKEADIFKAETAFGATHPGVYDEQQRLYELNWRGLSFSFPAPKDTSTLQTSYVKGTKIGSLQFVSSPPVPVKMTIFKGQSTMQKISSVPESVICGMCVPLLVKSIVSKGRIVGLDVEFFAQDNGSITSRKSDFPLRQFKRSIYFGDTTESVLSALGAPSKLNYRSDEKMMVHRGNESERLRQTQTHFFFNYFSLGMDILFNYHTNRVKKFVLHTNVPGHYDFGIYTRCIFSIAVGNKQAALTSDSRRDEFLDAFSAVSTDCESDSESDATQPVVLNRSASENVFDLTFCYGTDQIIVEVLNDGLIASVTIF